MGSAVSGNLCHCLWRAPKALQGKLSLGVGLTSLTGVKMGKSKAMCILSCEISISSSCSVLYTQKHSFFPPLGYVLLFRGMPSWSPAFSFRSFDVPIVLWFWCTHCFVILRSRDVLKAQAPVFSLLRFVLLNEHLSGLGTNHLDSISLYNLKGRRPRVLHCIGTL